MTAQNGENTILKDQHPNAHILRPDSLRGLHILRYKKGNLPELPGYEKQLIAMNIVGIISNLAETSDPATLIALGAYPLVDIFDPLMNKDCQIDIIKDRSEGVGFVLTHFGSSYERRHFYGSPTLLRDYLNHDISEYIEKKKREPATKNYGLVVNNALFPRDDIKKILSDYCPPLELISAKKRIEQSELSDRRRFEESVYRLYKYCTDTKVHEDRPDNFPVELKWPPVVIHTPDRGGQVEKLVTDHISHHSFNKHWLSRGKYMGIETLDGCIVAVVGYQGQCTYQQHEIIIATDAATLPEYRRQNITSALRRYSLERESAEAAKHGKRLIVIADFLDKPVAEKYGVEKLGYRFACTENNTRFAESYWIGLQLNQLNSGE